MNTMQRLTSAYTFADLFPYVNVGLGLVWASIITIFGFLIALGCTLIVLRPTINIKTMNKTWLYRLCAAIALSITITSALFLCFEIHDIQKAKSHGLYYSIFRLKWGEMNRHTKLSPEESELPDDLSNTIIIYFKYGCPDCEAIFKDEKRALKNTPNVYWVSTRSKQGKKLLKTYEVLEVPAGVYINADKQGSSYILYTTETKNGKPTVILNQAAITALTSSMSP